MDTENRAPRAPRMAVVKPAMWVAGLLLLLAFICLPAPAQVAVALEKVDFFGPNEGFGIQPERFRISAELTFPRPVTGQITAASINDGVIFDAAKKPASPLIDTLSAEKTHLGGERVVEAASSIYVQFYCGWIEGQTYKLGVAFRTDDGKTVIAQSKPLTAPEGGMLTAYPNYSVITVKEHSGLARQRWPVTIGIPMMCGDVKDPYSFLYLVRYDPGFKNEPVPFHVFDVVLPEIGPEIQEEFAKSGGFGRAAPHLFEIGFPADLPANGAGAYILYYGTPKAAAPRAEGRASLKYTGDNPGITIDTGSVVFGLNPKTGSLLNFTAKFGRKRQQYSFVQAEARDIHYNPDIWAPPLSWGHTSDWDLGKPGPYTPSLRITQSPYAYRSFRTGGMPRSNETKVDFTYTFFAGLPFCYTNSRMEFTLNTLVNAVRNSELVFSRGQITHGVWADEQGNPREARLYDPDDPKYVFEKVAVVSPDTQYVGMFNELDGVGICMVNLGRYVESFSPASDAVNYWTQYYISDLGLWLDSDHPDWAFVYMCRPEIYYPTIVPRGTVFAERNAILIFEVGAGEHRFDDLLRWVRLLRTPPAVTIAPVGIPPK